MAVKSFVVQVTEKKKFYNIRLRVKKQRMQRLNSQSTFKAGPIKIPELQDFRILEQVPML